MFLSETYSIQDLILYRATVSASDSFNISLPNHFEITTNVVKRSSTGAYCYYMTSTGYNIGSLRGNGSLTIRDGNGNLILDQNTSIIPNNVQKELRYEYNNGTHKLSCNGTELTLNQAVTIGNFIGMTLPNYTVTDLKIKPL